MKTSAIFEVHQVSIPFSTYNQPITIYPFGDVHHNSSNCDKEKFAEWCEEVKGRSNTYFIGMGDYLDSMSGSERRTFVGTALHDQSIGRIERAFMDDTKEFIKTIKFMKGRTLGVVGGNHFYKFAHGVTTDQLIADALDCRFLGVNCIIRVIFCRDKHHSHVLDICVHHGQGGGRTVGASMNKLEKMANFFDCDIILQGHDHNRAVDFINRLGITDSRRGGPYLTNKRILLARTGSWLKGYVEGRPSYVVENAYSPADLGAVRISITPRRTKDNGSDLRWLDINAEI